MTSVKVHIMTIVFCVLLISVLCMIVLLVTRFVIADEYVYVAQNDVELSEVTYKGNSVTKCTSFDNKNVKNTYGGTKYSHATVIDHYRHIQSTDVSLSKDSHRNASTKVPVNNTKLGVRFVCNTNNINTYYDIMKYDCLTNVDTLHASAAHRGLEHHNIGHTCVWGLYDVDFCNVIVYNSPLLIIWYMCTLLKMGKFLFFIISQLLKT